MQCDYNKYYWRPCRSSQPPSGLASPCGVLPSCMSASTQVSNGLRMYALRRHQGRMQSLTCCFDCTDSIVSYDRTFVFRGPIRAFINDGSEVGAPPPRLLGNRTFTKRRRRLEVQPASKSKRKGQRGAKNADPRQGQDGRVDPRIRGCHNTRPTFHTNPTYV